MRDLQSLTYVRLVMTQFKSLLLLSLALALLSSPALAAMEASSSSSSTTTSSTLETIAGIRNCTTAELSTISNVLSTNARILKCETDLKTQNLFNLTDPTVLCDDTSCTAGLNTLYSVLPECKINSVYAFQYLAGALLRNCGIVPYNETESSSSSSSGDVVVSSSSGSTTFAPVGTTATPTATTATPSSSGGSSAGTTTTSSASRIFQSCGVFALASMALLVLGITV